MPVVERCNREIVNSHSSNMNTCIRRYAFIIEFTFGWVYVTTDLALVFKHENFIVFHVFILIKNLFIILTRKTIVVITRKG